MIFSFVQACVCACVRSRMPVLDWVYIITFIGYLKTRRSFRNVHSSSWRVRRLCCFYIMFLLSFIPMCLCFLPCMLTCIIFCHYSLLGIAFIFIWEPTLIYTYIHSQKHAHIDKARERGGREEEERKKETESDFIESYRDSHTRVQVEVVKLRIQYFKT